MTHVPVSTSTLCGHVHFLRVTQVADITGSLAALALLVAGEVPMVCTTHRWSCAGEGLW